MIVERTSKHISYLTQQEVAVRAKQGWLISGIVPEPQFWLLVGVSSMHSDKIINALCDYLVRGTSRKEACNTHEVNSGHFSTSLNRLQHISHAVAKLAEYY